MSEPRLYSALLHRERANFNTSRMSEFMAVWGDNEMLTSWLRNGWEPDEWVNGCGCPRCVEYKKSHHWDED